MKQEVKRGVRRRITRNWMRELMGMLGNVRGKDRETKGGKTADTKREESRIQARRIQCRKGSRKGRLRG